MRYLHESPGRVEAAWDIKSWLEAFGWLEWGIVLKLIFLSKVLGEILVAQRPPAILTCKASRTIGMISPILTMEVGVIALIFVTWQPSTQLAEKSFRIWTDM